MLIYSGGLVATTLFFLASFPFASLLMFLSLLVTGFGYFQVKSNG